ncbi:MAG: sulfite exporter TauE/SafE family protein, partial [Nanoarchaeota archaeon]
VYILLKQLDVLPKYLGVTDNMGYGFIFILGLVAAMSTCLAVAGGLLLSVSAKFNERNPNASSWQKFKPHIFFNVGRVLSYTILGGAIGALGSVLTLSSGASGIITIIASILMIIMGLQLLGIFPWLNKLQIKMPKFLAHKVYDAESGNSSKIAPFLFGASTFFLPCGFTQALQLYVLGKGSFLTGALTMLAFSIGTLPSLMSIGAFSSFTKGNIQRYFTTFAAVLVIILGAVNLAPGFNLTGAVIALPSGDDTVPAVDIPLVDGKQVINMAVNGFDYSPDTFTLKKGVPVEWRIDGKGASGCAKVISVPALGILEQLPSSVKTIEFTPQKTGKIKFSCGMGMAGPGYFEVIA